MTTPQPQRRPFAGWLSETNDITRTFLAAGRVPGLINMAGGTNLGAESLAEIHDEVGRIAEAYLRQPLPVLLPDPAKLLFESR